MSQIQAFSGWKMGAYAASMKVPRSPYVMPMAGGFGRSAWLYEPATSNPNRLEISDRNRLRFTKSNMRLFPNFNDPKPSMVETGAKSMIPLEMAAEGSFLWRWSTLLFRPTTFPQQTSPALWRRTAAPKSWQNIQLDGQKQLNWPQRLTKARDHHPVAQSGQSVIFLSFPEMGIVILGDG